MTVPVGWRRWSDGEHDGPTMVGPACPACRSTVSYITGADLTTGRVELTCAICDCPHVPVPP